MFGANVLLLLYGETFWKTYTEGDNTSLIATDSMKNFIQRETMNFTGNDLEEYCRFLGEMFLAKYLQVEGLQISASEIPYTPLDGNVAFVPLGPDAATARIEIDRAGIVEAVSGVRGLRTRSAVCTPPFQWMVSTISRHASSTSAQICATTARTIRFFNVMSVASAVQTRSRSWASAEYARTSSGSAVARARVARASASRCSIEPASSSAAFHRRSSSPATVRFSGSTALYCRSARCAW